MSLICPKRLLPLLITLPVISFCQSALADDAANSEDLKNKVFSAAKSAEDYTGKRLSYPVEVTATLRDDPSKKICIPAYSRLRGMSKATAAGLMVTARRETYLPDYPWERKPEKHCAHPVTGQDEFSQHQTEAIIIDKKDVDSLPANISGLSYGLLVVPFKYHLSGSRDFKGSGSIGPYAGYKSESSAWGASVEIVGFGGLSSVPVEDVVDGKPKTTDVSAFSYGAGVIGRIRDNFQLGVIIGADRVGKSSNYPDNGKAWIAISVGYAFSN
jgi:hypothetical protein